MMVRPHTTKMPKKTGTALDNLSAFCDAAVAPGAQMRFSQVKFLATVAMYSPKGVNQTTLAKETGVTLGSISRSIDVFGSKGRKDRGGKGRNFLHVEADPLDDRNKIVTISSEGMDYLFTMIGYLGG